MTIPLRILPSFYAAMALPLLAVPSSANAAPARKAPAPKPAVAAPKPPMANNSIIPLPLNPIVPAAQRLCASQTPSGLGYTMLRAASGPMPATGDTVLVNYVGYLAATGAVFDQGMQAPLPVAGVIPGFGQGLQMTARGGVIRLCIPSALGYGAQGTGPIPANSDLIFQVEVLDFKTAAELDAMRKSQAAGQAPAPAQAPASAQPPGATRP